MPWTANPTNWIIADQITSMIRAIPARQILVISDSCYSGTLNRDITVEQLPPAGSERERFIERNGSRPSPYADGFGGNEPVADGGGSGHSVFAAALLRGLREMNRKRFTAEELFRSYVLQPVVGRAEQTPEYNPIRNSGHKDGDFVFVKLTAEDVSEDDKPLPLKWVAPVSGVWSGSFENSKKKSETVKITLQETPDGRISGNEDKWIIMNGRRDGNILTWEYKGNCRHYNVRMKVAEDGETMRGEYSVNDRYQRPHTYTETYILYKKQ